MNKLIELLLQAQEVLETNCDCGECGPCLLAKEIEEATKALTVMCPSCSGIFNQHDLREETVVTCPYCSKHLFTVVITE